MRCGPIRELNRGVRVRELRRRRLKQRRRHELYSLRCRPVRGDRWLDGMHRLRRCLFRFELGHVGVHGMLQGLLPDLTRPRLVFSLRGTEVRLRHGSYELHIVRRGQVRVELGEHQLRLMSGGLGERAGFRTVHQLRHGQVSSFDGKSEL